MSDEDIEARIQRALVDRDRLQKLEEERGSLKRREKIYLQALEEIRDILGTISRDIGKIQSRIQDLEDIE